MANTLSLYITIIVQLIEHCNLYATKIDFFFLFKTTIIALRRQFRDDIRTDFRYTVVFIIFYFVAYKVM